MAVSPDRLLPAWLVEHARRFHAGGGTPVAPRRAATVVLLRDTAAGLAAYTIRRAATMAFASGMYAFPGGSVDPRDAEPGAGWAGPDPDRWAGLLGLTGTGEAGGPDVDAGPDSVPAPGAGTGPAAAARAVVCAALRETFEETGVLLAGPAADTVVGDVSGDRWEAARRSLVGHELGFAEFLAAEGLLPRSDLVRPWARWITPEFEPRRYDTFFFVATLPAGQRTRDVSGEADRTAWVPPAGAVADAAAGRLAMLPPTMVMLSALAGFGTAAEVLAAATDRRLAPVTPRVVLTGPTPHLVLPGEPGYN